MNLSKTKTKDRQMGTLHDYAKEELEKAGHFSEDSAYNGMLGKAVLDLIDQFSSEGHSGFSAMACLGIFGRLAKFHPLTPLTGEDDEWYEVGPGIYQNRRCGHVFKEKDGAYDSEGYVFKDREDGSTWTNYESRKPITFPYTVPDGPIVLWADTKEPVRGIGFNQYQDRARTTAVYAGSGEMLGVYYTALGMAGEAGEAADQTSKIIRDDSGQLTDIRKNKLLNELGDTLWYLANFAYELGFSLEEVAAFNLKKLADRKAREVLHGDGGIR